MAKAKPAVRSQQQQSEPIPVIPLSEWAPWLNRVLPVRLPKARRPGQTFLFGDLGRLRLLWSAEIPAVLDDRPFTWTVFAAEVASQQDSTTLAMLLESGHTAADCTLDPRPDRNWTWHRRRAIEIAKAAAAGLRERFAPEPEVPAQTEWLRRQIDRLDAR